jgi:hypothetical protein
MRSPWTDPDKPGMQTALHLSVDRVPAIAAAVAVMREVHGAWSPSDSTPCGGCNCKLRASGRKEHRQHAYEPSEVSGLYACQVPLSTCLSLSGHC